MEQGDEDVGTSRRAVVREDQTQTTTGQCRTDEQVHEFVFAYGDDGMSLKKRLHHTYHHRHDAYTDDGADEKLSGEGFDGYDEHQGVDGPDRDTSRDVEGIVKQR